MIDCVFRVLGLTAITIGALAAGCRTISKELTEAVFDREQTEQWHVHYGSRIQYTLDDDAITAVGATPTANSLDFELALFKAREQPSVALTVERRDVGTLTLELVLQRPEASGDAHRKAGKRRRSLSEGRMETSIKPVSSGR